MYKKLGDISVAEALSIVTVSYLLISVIYMTGYLILIDISLVRMLDYKDFLIGGGLPFSLIVIACSIGFISSQADMDTIIEKKGKNGETSQSTLYNENLNLIKLFFFPMWPYYIFRFLIDTKFFIISLIIYWGVFSGVLYLVFMYDGNLSERLRLIVNSTYPLFIFIHLFMTFTIANAGRQLAVLLVIIHIALASFISGKIAFVRKFWRPSNTIIRFVSGEEIRAEFFGNYSDFYLIRTSGQSRLVQKNDVKLIIFDTLNRNASMNAVPDREKI
jgi:hypothetical protein